MRKDYKIGYDINIIITQFSGKDSSMIDSIDSEK